MSDEYADVGPEPGTQVSKVLREALPRERHSVLQQTTLHVLDGPEDLDDSVAMRSSNRSERDRAVADDERRDTVLGRRRREAVPAKLRVVVRVDVDEARRHDVPAGVDFPRAPTVDTAHCDNAIRRYREVAAASRGSRPIHDARVADHQRQFARNAHTHAPVENIRLAPPRSARRAPWRAGGVEGALQFEPP